MTFLKKILSIGFVFSICSTIYADDNIIVTSTENASFSIQQLQEQLNKLQAHVYTVLPLEAQESMSGATQDPETALKQFDSNKVKAQLGSKLEELRTDMAELRGKLEEASHTINMQATKIEKLQQKLTTALTQMTSPPPAPMTNAPMPPVPDQSAVAMPDSPVSGSPIISPIVAVAPEIVAATPTPSTEDVVANEIKSLDAKGAFERSKEYIRQGDYDKAETALKTFVETFSAHTLVSSGYYYLGELYYIQQKFKEAVSIFAEGYKSQPEGEKAPDSLLKMAQCFDALKQSQEACATLAKLHKTFKTLDPNLKATAHKLKITLKCPDNK